MMRLPPTLISCPRPTWFSGFNAPRSYCAGPNAPLKYVGANIAIFALGLPHVTLIELRLALISYQDYHMLLLRYVEANIATWVANGAVASKLLLGIPWYGLARSWS